MVVSREAVELVQGVLAEAHGEPELMTEALECWCLLASSLSPHQMLTELQRKVRSGLWLVVGFGFRLRICT